MPYYNLYKPLIQSETIVSRTRLKPRNIYRISTYKYVDGTQKSLTGLSSTLVFVIGITPDRKLNCLKISEIRPFIFFRWLSTVIKPNITDEMIDELVKLDEVVKNSDKLGRSLFNTSIKGKPIYKRKEHIYRTYNISGVKKISEVIFNSDTLKKYIDTKE